MSVSKKITEREEQKMVSKKELLAVAKELNEVLGLDPEIPLKGAGAGLKEIIMKALELVAEGDVFSDDVQATIDILVAEEEEEEVVESGEAEEEETEKEAEKEMEKEVEAEEPVKAKKSAVGKKVSKAKAKKSAVGKKVSKAKGLKKKKISEKLAFFVPYIEKGTYTRKELLELAMKEFPHIAKSTFQTMLTDSKNPKYCVYDRIVVEGEDKTLSFGDEL